MQGAAIITFFIRAVLISAFQSEKMAYQTSGALLMAAAALPQGLPKQLANNTTMPHTPTARASRRLMAGHDARPAAQVLDLQLQSAASQQRRQVANAPHELTIALTGAPVSHVTHL